MANCKLCVHKMACAIYADNRDKVILSGFDCKGYKETSKKPIIRHCKNCKWVCLDVFTDSVTCSVKYKHILSEEQRTSALLCRYYSEEDGGNNDGMDGLH